MSAQVIEDAERLALGVLDQPLHEVAPKPVVHGARETRRSWRPQRCGARLALSGHNLADLLPR